MKMNVQHHTWAALPPRDRVSVPKEKENSWDPGPVRTWYQKQKFLPLPYWTDMEQN
jgi:hypothetical protein